MWTVKEFKSEKAMNKWLKKKEGKIQYTEIFVNNGYAIEWRKLKVIKI